MTALINAETASATLGEISEFITKGATPTTYGFAWESSGVPFLRSECVSERGLDMRGSMFISPTANQALRRSQVTDGDILMTITGYVGRVIRLAGVGEANINQHIARVRIKDSRFDSGYVYHYLSQPSMREHYESIITGQAYPQISLAQVRDTKIPAIPLEEQQKIAVSLDSADDFIATLDRMFTKKQAIKQGLMHQLLTGKVTFTGSPTSGSDVALGEITTWLSGGTPDRNNPAYWGGTIPWISAATLRYSRVHKSDQHLTETGARAGSKLAPVGATLILVRGMALHREARIGMATRPVSFNQDVKALIPKADVLPEYLLYALQARSTQVLDLVSSAGSGTGVLNTQLLQRIPIWVPDKATQRRIVTAVDAADRQVEALGRFISKMQAIKQGMRQELLTGRTRLSKKENTA